MSISDTLSASYIDGSYRRQALRQARWTIKIVVVSVIIAVGWAAFAQIDQITRGDGRVIPLHRMQVIQSLDGGILDELPVSEGDAVRQGEVVARLDDTRARSAYQAGQSEIESLQAEVARLAAEALDQPVLDFGATPTETEQTELRLFSARRTRLESSLAALSDERAAVQEQLNITGPLASDGEPGQIDVLQLRQKSAELTGRINEIRNGYLEQVYRDLAVRRGRLTLLEQDLIRKADDLRRTVILSPVDGRVNNISITTLGGVVRPGEQIMQITPVGDQLLIETRILPRDVAFIAPGMPASVKITAYNFAVYGDLRGQVTQISEDTVLEDTPTGPQNFYRVIVKTERDYLERFGERLPIRPGMVAQVDIESGSQSVLNYLMRPVLRARLR
ncbi:MAG: HlyD family efflux transporter periplasmic adaptor subunit [Paracoccus sp. (in: a-proteobacteria)]